MSSVAAVAQSASGPIPVTVDNYVRAETDMYFKLWAGDGALGKFVHFRDFPLDKTGVRPNRDTFIRSLYSTSTRGR